MNIRSKTTESRADQEVQILRNGDAIGQRGGLPAARQKNDCVSIVSAFLLLEFAPPAQRVLLCCFTFGRFVPVEFGGGEELTSDSFVLR